MAQYDPNEDYWSSYNNLQNVKHALLRRYLDAWFPILTQGGFPKVAYVETHAGRGRHKGGQPGSPIVAIESLLTHRRLPAITQKSAVNYRFIELDNTNAKALRAELDQISLPRGVSAEIITADFRDFLSRVESAAMKKEKLSKAFFFVDPFGYALPVTRLAQIAALTNCEFLINFMWRYVDMALNDDTKTSNLDALFGEHNWQDLAEMANVNVRCDIAVERIAARLGQNYHLSIKMLGPNGTPKYVLIHSAQSDRAFEVMKEAVWAVIPEGQFLVRQGDDPNQEILLHAEPDFSPLRNEIWRRYGGLWVCTNEVDQFVSTKTLYRQKHWRDLARNWVQEGRIKLAEGTKLVFSKNPKILFEK